MIAGRGGEAEAWFCSLQAGEAVWLALIEAEGQMSLSREVGFLSQRAVWGASG